jgi:hypothetical protein
MAERMVAPESGVIRLPDGVGFDVGSTVRYAYGTADYALARARLVSKSATTSPTAHAVWHSNKSKPAWPCAWRYSTPAHASAKATPLPEKLPSETAERNRPGRPGCDSNPLAAV